jgi:hypothetical protein
MRRRFSDAGYDLGTGDGPIVTPHFSDRDTLYAIAHGLYKRGVHAVPVTYPIVENGRGRIRFICSAAHSREDVDRTLEALMEAEREAEEERRAAQAQASIASGLDADTDVRSGREGVEAWAQGFRTYLKELAARSPGAVPNLAISIGLPGDREWMTVAIEERELTLGDLAPARAPRCSLRFRDERAVSFFCSSDVQGLLDGIVKGACVLTGQVEPFVWLIGRMADWVDPTRTGGHPR